MKLDLIKWRGVLYLAQLVRNKIVFNHNFYIRKYLHMSIFITWKMTNERNVWRVYGGLLYTQNREWQWRDENHAFWRVSFINK